VSAAQWLTALLADFANARSAAVLLGVFRALARVGVSVYHSPWAG
jgi:hypothetical protein